MNLRLLDACGVAWMSKRCLDGCYLELLTCTKRTSGPKSPMILLDFMYRLKPVRENLAIAK